MLMERRYLKRTSKTDDGTWGVWLNKDKRPVCFMAEIPNTFLLPGIYLCVLQTHYPKNEKAKPYPAYEITNVIDRDGRLHTDVEIHIANVPKMDLAGCVAPGLTTGENTDAKSKYFRKWGVWNSTAAFNLIMKDLAGVEEFQLEVIDP